MMEMQYFVNITIVSNRYHLALNAILDKFNNYYNHIPSIYIIDHDLVRRYKLKFLRSCNSDEEYCEYENMVSNLY